MPRKPISRPSRSRRATRARCSSSPTTTCVPATRNPPSPSCASSPSPNRRSVPLAPWEAFSRGTRLATPKRRRSSRRLSPKQSPKSSRSISDRELFGLCFGESLLEDRLRFGVASLVPREKASQGAKGTERRLGLGELAQEGLGGFRVAGTHVVVGEDEQRARVARRDLDGLEIGFLGILGAL